jgi:hypothetical protein
MGRDNKTTNWSGSRNTTTGDATQPPPRSRNTTTNRRSNLHYLEMTPMFLMDKRWLKMMTTIKRTVRMRTIYLPNEFYISESAIL